MNSSMSSQPAAGNGASAHGRTGMMDGAAKVFREFKWGLLTLFLLMVVVIGLVYDGGKKKAAEKEKAAAAPPATPKAEPAPNLTADDGGFSFGVDSRPPEPSRSQPSGTDTLAPATQPRGGATEYAPWNQTQPATLPAVPQRTPVLPKNTMTSATTTVPATVAPVTPVRNAAETLYTVQPGDTLSGIAGRHYPGKPQRGIKAISEANKSTLPDIHMLRPGMKLKIPALAEQAAPAAGAAASTNTSASAKPAKPADPKAPAAADSGEYTVQAGDTLERIARKQLSNGPRWNEIFELNRDRISDPARLKIGQKLRIPANGASAETKDVAPKPEQQAEKESSLAQQNPEPKRAPVSSELPWMP